MGQFKRTDQQIQNEIDEIHRLLSAGATDEHIMNGRKDEQGRSIRIPRATFFRRKKKLIQQVSDQWRAKRDEDYIHEVQICKERLTRQLVNATSHSQQQNANALWGAIAGELTVSILKLEVEGILAIKNGKLKQLEEKVRYLQSNESGAPLSASALDGWTNKTQTAQTIQLPNEDQIPRDPQKFYEDFGLLNHPKTSLPSPKLTSYQYDVWKSGQYHKYRLIVKSQKIGLSTSVLMEDFQRAITSCKGREILVIAQTIDKARDHLYTLRRMILNSKKYKPYLILKRTELLLPDEVTKVTVLFIHNPDNPSQPTKIIGLGGNEASIWSFKEVKHIHMSDIAVITKKDYSGVINAAMTRLANTDGTMIIETPPYGPRGKVYEIYMQSKLAKGDSIEGQFKLFTIPAREAVAANLITQEFLEGQKIELGSQYAAYYEAEFSAATGSVFHIEDVEAASRYPYDPNEPLPYGGVSCIGVDPGFGSSPFGICVSNFIDGKARIRFADEFPRPDHEEMALQIWDLIQYHNCNKVYIDNSSPSMIKSLKIHWGERSDYENIDREQYRFMKVEPISFGREHKNMLAHAKMMVDKHYVAIHPGFEKLIVSLKTAVEHNGSLDKEVTAYDNVFDAFRLCMLRYKEETKKP